MLKEVCNIQRKNLENHTKAQKGYLGVLSEELAPKVADYSISQPPEVYFKWLLRKKVPFRKTLLAQFKIITITVCGIILDLKT